MTVFLDQLERTTLGEASPTSSMKKPSQAPGLKGKNPAFSAGFSVDRSISDIERLRWLIEATLSAPL
jgi:hypothetical protein